MRDPNPATVFRSDYRPPGHLVERVEMVLDLDADCTEVCTTLRMLRNRSAAGAALLLNGDGLELVSIELDGRALDPGQYEERAGNLVVTARLPERFARPKGSGGSRISRTDRT
jgi:aminopeptidase N